ncbi:unnamed protein product [Lathyrus oleraceus]
MACIACCQRAARQRKSQMQGMTMFKVWQGQNQMDAKKRFLAHESNDHGILYKSEYVISIRV